MFEEILKKLLSVYDKRPTSNIAKLLRILSDQLEDIKGTFNLIDEWRDIDKAKGKTLDLIGTNVNQWRGTSTDEIYRILIKSKIARGLSTGDINTIIEILSTALNCNPSEIGIKQHYEDGTGSAAISINEIPITRLNEVGMSGEQFGLLVKKIVAAGIKVNQVELTGTFQFASSNNTELDPNAGFSDIEGTTGGYFGAAFNPGQITLPI